MTTLTAGDLEMTLAARTNLGAIKIDSLYDTAAAQELLGATPSPVPLLRIALHNPADGSKQLIHSNSDWSNPTVTSTAAGADFSLGSHSTYTDISVSGSVKAVPDEDAFKWDLSITNNSTTWSLYKISYPLATFTDLTNGTLFDPDQCGATIDYVTTDYTALRDIPKNVTQQFMALSGDASSLYAGMHDPTPAQRRLSMDSTNPNGIDLTAWHYAPDMTVAGNDFTLSGKGVWKLYRGDWFDAAKYHREWVRSSARWYPTQNLGVDGRTDTPKWIKDVPMWIGLHMGHYLDADGNEDYATAVQTAIDHQAYMDVPIVVHFYQWHQIEMNNDFPQYFPVDPDFPQAVQDLQANGMYVVPYVNCKLWDIRDNGTAQDEWPSVGQPNCMKNEDGDIYVELYNRPEADGSPVYNSVMCPATQGWEDKLTTIASRLETEVGVDGIYLDQLSAECFVTVNELYTGGDPSDAANYTASPYVDKKSRTLTDDVPTCMDASHGHPTGGGSWHIDGYRSIAQSIQDATDDDFGIVGEVAPHFYADVIDGGLVFPWGRGNATTPAHPAVYSGGSYLQFGRVYNGYVDEMGMNVLTAQSLTWGNQLGWWNEDFHVDFPSAAAFARTCVRLRQQLTHVFTNGKFMRPIDLGVPTITTARNNGPTITSPAVEHGIFYQAPENELAIIFANPSNTTHTATVDISLSDYGITGNASVRRINSTGPTGTTFATGNQFSSAPTVAANDAWAWLITQRDSPPPADGDSLTSAGDSISV